MASLNKVQLIGYLGRDPEVHTFQNGDSVCNATLATSERWKDKQTGEQKEATEWHSLVFHRREAEIAGQYLRKGSLVYVEGSLKTRKWQDQSGNDRYTTEVRVSRLQILPSRDDGQRQQQDGQRRRQEYQSQRQQPQQQQSQRQGSGFDDMDDDIPF